MSLDEQSHIAALSLLVCPKDQCKLGLNPGTNTLCCEKCGSHYSIFNDIARFDRASLNAGQDQVRDGFNFKWNHHDWGYANEHIAVMKRFFNERFQFKDEHSVEVFFKNKCVLHAGVGNGQDEQHYLKYCKEVWGADISGSVDACRRNWDGRYPDLAKRFHLCQADLMELPFPDNSFDIVLSDGVLHHTPDTYAALRAISRKVKSGGHVVFYVYKKKTPIREFVDDYIRAQVSGMPPEAAWKAMEPLTALARDLSAHKHEIDIPEDIPLLEITKGRFDLQRWLYWNVMKFYWNDAFSFDENTHVNFDWYYPAYAWRHTPEEVKSWLSELGLKEIVFNVGDSGISVIAEK